MEFYKKRSFGEIISDSFEFLKRYGKNYFKNYLLINGLLLTLLVVLFIFGYREFLMQIIGSNLQGQSYFFEQYFQENTGVLITVTTLITLLFLLFSIINYSFPVFYMKRVGENPEKKITTDEIIGDIKDHFGKLLILFLGITFIVTPVAIILVGISYLLVFILIGFVLLMLVMPFIMNVINFIFYDYLHTQKGFFESLSYAFKSQFSYPHQAEGSPFWKYTGGTLIIYFIIQTIATIFTIIPLGILLAILLTSPETVKSFDDPNTNPLSGGIGVMIFVVYGISILCSFILSNLIYISAGLMYFDSRTDLHRNKDLEAIESIGQNA